MAKDNTGHVMSARKIEELEDRIDLAESYQEIAEGELNDLVELAIEALGFCRHLPGCTVMPQVGRPCTCGWDDMAARLVEELEPHF